MRIIIETMGGIVTQVYADGDVYVDVLDLDDEKMEDEYATEVSKQLSALKESGDVKAYW